MTIIMLKKIWIACIFWISCFLVSIRYRVKVVGLEKLTPEMLSKKRGIVFLPNHPASMDPVIVLLALWRKFQPHALVVEYFYYMKGLHYLMKLVGTIPIPDLEGVANKWKQKKVSKTFAEIAEGIKKGENYLIYPSGRLKVGAQEVIGGASLTHSLLQECPDANIVLIRTTGLWGSRFSKAIQGTRPDVGKNLLEGIKIVLKNLIFFVPKREVTVEIETAPADLPIHGSRVEFNQYLERWYNLPGPEPLKLISDYFWKESFPSLEQKVEDEKEKEQWTISPASEKKIIDKLKQLTQQKEVHRSQYLDRDLGMDSLDIAQLYTFLEEHFSTGDITFGSIQTVEDVLKAASKNEKQQIRQLTKHENDWPEEKSRPPILPPPGKTLQEAFLKNCDRMGHFAACADELTGILNYRRFKLAALVLSQKISRLDGDSIGILMPSSVVSSMLIFAILLANKVPVMLNWTLGERALSHCIKLAGLKTVLSSRRFLDNLTSVDLGDIDNMLLLLEDLRTGISLWDKLRGKYLSYKKASSLLKKLHLISAAEDDPAVILFTSGTEALPKGVPLSHKNIISNQASALSCIEVFPTDSLYSVLPPFHSFGLSVNGILPFVMGIKSYYAPDPTHYHGMAHDISHWGITIFDCAPTFIKGVFQVAQPGQLDSLRYVVSGAEKAPEELFVYMQKLGGQVIEGYGITECSPAVTITRPGKARVGVGQPIPGVELCIIEPETGKLMPSDQDGEVCIHGPNVFLGYLGSQKSPFIEIQGRRWYRSGDRGHIAPDGSLVLTGRLKRFAKIGGEMISLGGLEEEILKLALERKWLKELKDTNPPLAVAVLEKESEKPLIVLFATFAVEKEEINHALRDLGYGRLIKIAEVRRIDQIPVTATGKIQLSALDELLKKQ